MIYNVKKFGFPHEGERAFSPCMFFFLSNFSPSMCISVLLTSAWTTMGTLSPFTIRASSMPWSTVMPSYLAWEISIRSSSSNRTLCECGNYWACRS